MYYTFTFTINTFFGMNTSLALCDMRCFSYQGVAHDFQHQCCTHHTGRCTHEDIHYARKLRGM